MTESAADSSSATSRCTRSHPEAGFTLLELLIAITLLGMLATMLAAGLRTGTRAWERGEARAAGTDDVRFAQAFLRRALGAAYPLLVTKDRRRLAIDFEGQPNAVVFLGPMPTSLAPGGRARITLAEATHRDRVELVVKAQLELAQGHGEEVQPETLLPRLSGVAFRYYGGTDQGEAAGWHDRWVERSALPRLIHVQVSFPSGDPRRWPGLLISPHIIADVSCGYDPVAKQCRSR